jgi:hypothetical protein
MESSQLMYNYSKMQELAKDVLSKQSEKVKMDASIKKR